MDSTKTILPNNKTVAFQTSCYEATWRKLLEEGKLEKDLALFSENLFSEKRLIINNINKDSSFSAIEKFVLRNELGIGITTLFFDKNREKILNHFGLSLKDFPVGLYYSIQHFMGLYFTKADYLFHVSEDCDIGKLDDRFIIECVEEMEKTSNLIVAFPRWCPDTGSNFEQVLPKTDKFYFQFGFTDQVYLIKTEAFKKTIYNYSHPVSERYPWYGGESFEKRIDAYMRRENMYGIVHREYEYTHG